MSASIAGWMFCEDLDQEAINLKRNLRMGILASVISIVAIVGLLSMPHVAQAAVCTWTGATDSDWAKPNNWTGCGGVTPTLIDSIVINNTANQPIIYSGTNPSTLYALTLDSGASLRVSGTITFGGGTLAGLINVQPGGLVHIKGYSILSGTLAVQSGGNAHIEGQGSGETTLTEQRRLDGCGRSAGHERQPSDLIMGWQFMANTHSRVY